MPVLVATKTVCGQESVSAINMTESGLAVTAFAALFFLDKRLAVTAFAVAWMNVWLSQHLLHGVGLAKCLAQVSLRPVSRYEEERLPRVKTVYEKGKSAASAEDKERYLYKPTFKPLWQKKVCCIIRGLFGVPCCDETAIHALMFCLLRLRCQSPHVNVNPANRVQACTAMHVEASCK